MSEDINIGDRIRELRKRRGMTQEDLADRAGLSRDLIKKVERGGTARMETYNAIARALNVVVLTFATPQAPEPHQNVSHSLALAEMYAAISPPLDIRGDPVYVRGSDEPNLSMLGEATRAVTIAYHASRYDTVARLTPAVLRSAHLHVDELDGDDQACALRLRADALNVAGRYLIQVREHNLALMALRDSLNDALAIGDQPLAASAISSQAWALLRQARFAEAEQLCASSADAVEPHVSKATPDELSAWGWLLLRAASAAARNNRSGEAREYQRYAASAASPLDEEIHTYARGFGPLTVALQGKEMELVMGRPDKALRLSDQLPTGVGRTDSSTWYRHRVTTAKAHVETGDADAATVILKDLKTRAPEWFRYQQAAREVSEDIIASRKRMPSADQLEIANFLGVTA